MGYTRSVVALVAAVTAIALTVSLGTWQLRRADEKLALQAAWDRAEQAAPLTVAGSDFDAVAGQLPRLTDYAAALGINHAAVLQMPSIMVR